MCNFCSAITKGDGKLVLFNWEIRKRLLKDNPKQLNPDSHASICDYFNMGKREDKCNKYEYNPLTKKFIVNQINIKDDRALAKRNFEKLDWKTIVKPLIIKKIINPLTDIKKYKIITEDINNLKKWNSVRDSVGNSVWDSVGNSVRDSVGNSVGNPVRDSVWDSVWNSVGNSVGNSVRDSVWDFVRAYISSFFDIKYEYDFSSLIRLWERGFVPSFDGKVWRLHQGKDAKIIYEGKI